MRTLELPPLTDRKELATAVRFQAEDQVPMPLDNAVLDFHALGVIDTPAGPRQRVIVVAAQRDMVERLIAAVRAAGLRPEGVDLSLCLDPLAAPRRRGPCRSRSLPERGRAHEHGDSRGHRLPFHTRDRRWSRVDGRRRRRAQHQADRGARAAGGGPP